MTSGNPMAEIKFSDSSNDEGSPVTVTIDSTQSDSTILNEVLSLIQQEVDPGHYDSSGRKADKASPGLAVLGVEIQRLSQWGDQMENFMKLNKEKLGPLAIKNLETIMEHVSTHQEATESAKSLLMKQAKLEEPAKRRRGIAEAELKAMEAAAAARVKGAEAAEAKAFAAKAALEARRQKVEAAYKEIRERKGGSEGRKRQWELSKELSEQRMKLEQELERNEATAKSLTERELALKLQVIDLNSEAQLLKKQALDVKTREDGLLLVERNLWGLQKNAKRLADRLESFFAGHHFRRPSQ